MQMNAFSDYTLRILIYLALEEGRLVTSREIAKAYNLSFDHIAKAAQFLARKGYVRAVRGRSGGVALAMKPEEISIGEVLRATEAGSGLVECMRPGPVKCVIAQACGLAPLLAGANEAFFQSLDKKTLADALPGRRGLKKALGLATA